MWGFIGGPAITEYYPRVGVALARSSNVTTVRTGNPAPSVQNRAHVDDTSFLTRWEQYHISQNVLK